MDKQRTKNLITAVIDESLCEEKQAGANPNKIKDGNSVSVLRGAQTGMTGDVTYISPCGTLADVKFDNGQIGRVSTAFLAKKSKPKAKKSKAKKKK